MTLRSILVPTASRLDLPGPLDTALAIARPLLAHIDLIYFSPPPSILMTQAPEGSMDTLGSDEIRQAFHAARDRAKLIFEDWCTHNGISHASKHHLLGSTFARWKEEEQELAQGVAQWGRLADLIVANRPEPFNVPASQCFDAAVFASGRPTLLVSRVEDLNPLRHVLIAWNGSLESTRAISLTLDLLHTAGRVSIFSARDGYEGNTTEQDLAAALRWHGIESNCLRVASPADSPGEALLEAAHEQDVSLILMGAYTHSRIRETFLGGATRHLLHHADIPVIMAH